MRDEQVGKTTEQDALRTEVMVEMWRVESKKDMEFWGRWEVSLMGGGFGGEGFLGGGGGWGEGGGGGGWGGGGFWWVVE